MFKVGDKVVCVESTKGITYGKVYTVLDDEKWSDMSVIEIIDDVDEKAWYYTSRFTSAIIKNPDPQATISQSEYDNLVAEINMLQELITELSTPQDTAQKQQAETYRALQMLLVAHPSFQDGAGENTTHLNELVNTVLELQAAWDRLASVPAVEDVVTSGFKPISEYTLADWELAYKEGWEFECRDGYFTKIVSIDNGETSWPVESAQVWLRLDGTAAGTDSPDDIVKRIK